MYRLDDFERGTLNPDKTDVNSPTRTQAWTLDQHGNWSSTTIDGSTEDRSHNQVNELTDRTPPGGTQIDLSYDATGNLTQEGSSDGLLMSRQTAFLETAWSSVAS